MSQLSLRLAEIEELLRLKNAELSEKEMQLLRAQSEGDKGQTELEELRGIAQRLQVKLDSAQVRPFMECLHVTLVVV